MVLYNSFPYAIFMCRVRGGCRFNVSAAYNNSEASHWWAYSYLASSLYASANTWYLAAIQVSARRRCERARAVATVCATSHTYCCRVVCIVPAPTTSVARSSTPPPHRALSHACLSARIVFRVQASPVTASDLRLVVYVNGNWYNDQGHPNTGAAGNPGIYSIPGAFSARHVARPCCPHLECSTSAFVASLLIVSFHFCVYCRHGEYLAIVIGCG